MVAPTIVTSPHGQAATLTNQQRAQIWRVFRAWTGDPAVADDLTQETLIAAWRSDRRPRAEDVLDAKWRRAKAGLGSETISSFAFAACVAIALWTITGQNQSIGTWVVVTTGMDWLSGLVRAFAQVARSTREQVAYAGDLFAFEEQADGFIAAERRTRSAAPAATSKDVPTGDDASAPGIVIRNVSFAYPGGSGPVIRDLTVTIAPGETVAIVGENGAG